MEKACKTCGEMKPEEGFSLNSRSTTTRALHCRSCITAKQRAKYYSDPEVRKRRIAYSCAYQAKAENRARASARQLASYHASEKEKERRRRNARSRYAERRKDPRVVLNHRISCMMRQTLSAKKARSPTYRLLGYSPAELKRHIEAQFLPGMSWANMSEWHIDHIVPLSSFDISGPDDPEFKRAWALTNLRPLWAKDNRRKHARRTHLI